MSPSHAVAWIEPLDAHVLALAPAHAVDERVNKPLHYTRQRGSLLRGQHEFFSEVCEALADSKSVLVVGQHDPETAFRQYVSKHRPALALHVVGWQTMAHPTEPEVLTLAREFFAHRDELLAAQRTA
jgi:hypothetical protein